MSYFLNRFTLENWIIKHSGQPDESVSSFAGIYNYNRRFLRKVILQRERSTAEEITLNQHARDKLRDKLFKYVCWLSHRVQWNMRVSGKLGATQTSRFTDFRGENLRIVNHKFSGWKTKHIYWIGPMYWKNVSIQLKKHMPPHKGTAIRNKCELYHALSVSIVRPKQKRLLNAVRRIDDRKHPGRYKSGRVQL